MVWNCKPLVTCLYAEGTGVSIFFHYIFILYPRGYENFYLEILEVHMKAILFVLFFPITLPCYLIISVLRLIGIASFTDDLFDFFD